MAAMPLLRLAPMVPRTPNTPYSNGLPAQATRALSSQSIPPYLHSKINQVIYSLRPSTLHHFPHLISPSKHAERPPNLRTLSLGRVIAIIKCDFYERPSSVRCFWLIVGLPLCILGPLILCSSFSLIRYEDFKPTYTNQPFLPSPQ